MSRRHGWLPAVAVACLVTTLGACGARMPRVETLPGERVERHEPEAVEAALRGFLHVEAGEWEEAADAFRTAIHHDPGAWTLHLALGGALAHVPDSLREGLMACNLAAELDAPASDVGLCRSANHEAEEDTERALEAVRDVPDDEASADVFRARIRFATRLDEETRIEEARRWATARPDDPDAHRAVGAALEESDPIAAAAAYERATQQPGALPEDAYRQIRLLAEADANERALDAARSCHERFWEYWPCLSWQAVLAHRLRTDPDAIAPESAEALEKLAFFVAADPRQLSSSGWEIQEYGDPMLVRAYAHIVADARPGNVSALLGAGWIAHGIEDYDLAVELMERALAVDDSNFDALNYIGYTWAEEGTNLERAEEYIRRALFLRGDDGNILDSLAWVLYRQGRHEEALDVQLRAAELVPDSAVVWDHLGDIQHALGRVDEALESWERALELATEDDEDVLEDAPRKIEDARGRS